MKFDLVAVIKGIGEFLAGIVKIGTDVAWIGVKLVLPLFVLAIASDVILKTNFAVITGLVDVLAKVGISGNVLTFILGAVVIGLLANKK